MPHDAEHIAALHAARKQRLAGRFERMAEVSEVYNGQADVPLPELSADERAAVPNLTQIGTDQTARRSASVLPNMVWPPTRPGIKVSEDRASARRQVAYGWWQLTDMRTVIAQRARWFIAYASAPVVIRPDKRTGCPRWEPHNPFDVFPSHVDLNSFTPDDVILRHKRTLRWLRERYPEAAVQVSEYDSKPDDLYDVLECIDADWVSYTVTGKTDGYGTPGTDQAVMCGPPIPNRAGVCWAVVPTRVCLDAPMGQFDEMVGMYKTQAALMALQVIATRRAIWPNTWLVNPNTGMVPNIVQEPDPETGTPGILVNGILDRQQLDPSFQAQTVIDHLEASQRQTASVPAELSGAGGQNVRTGRRASQLMSASVDFVVAEVQDAFARSLHEENLRAIAVDKGYFDYQKSFYVSTKGARGKVEYKPSDIFDETSEHIVEYPLAGTDLSDLVINGGQRVAMGTLSKESFMEIDPLVSDTDAEVNRVRFEALETAWLTATQTLASSPDGPMQIPDLTRIAKKMFAEQLPWYEAVDAVQREKQAEQAQGAEAMSPEAQPGLAMPGQGAEVPVIGEPGPSMSNITQVLNQLGSADTALALR